MDLAQNKPAQDAPRQDAPRQDAPRQDAQQAPQKAQYKSANVFFKADLPGGAQIRVEAGVRKAQGEENEGPKAFT